MLVHLQKAFSSAARGGGAGPSGPGASAAAAVSLLLKQAEGSGAGVPESGLQRVGHAFVKATTDILAHLPSNERGVIVTRALQLEDKLFSIARAYRHTSYDLWRPYVRFAQTLKHSQLWLARVGAAISRRDVAATRALVAELQDDLLGQQMAAVQRGMGALRQVISDLESVSGDVAGSRRTWRAWLARQRTRSATGRGSVSRRR